jgi:hypothetical protein
MEILSLQMNYDSFDEESFYLTLFQSSFHPGFVQKFPAIPQG